MHLTELKALHVSQLLEMAASLDIDNASRLRNSPDDVQRLIGVVRQVLDRRRFAWIVEDRDPTEAERNAAVMASAALMAASRTQTSRRTSLPRVGT